MMHQERMDRQLNFLQELQQMLHLIGHWHPHNQHLQGRKCSRDTLPELSKRT